MMEKTDIIIAQGDVKIHCYYFIPDNKKSIKGIVQIAHGLGEHVGRYRELANYFTDEGYVVCAEDHRGFGKSVLDRGDMGHIGDKDGYNLILSDMYTLMKKTKSEFGDDIDYFLFGHSFGSMLSRGFAIRYGNEISGMMLSSTKGSKDFVEYFASVLASIQKMVFGEKSKANFMHKLSIGGYAKKYFPEDNNTAAWLTRDKIEQVKFLKDEYCLNGASSIATYIEIFKMLDEISDKKMIDKMPKTLPIFILAGQRDPVGDFSKNVLKLYATYRRLDFTNVVIKVYKDARHELIKEIDKKIVIDDIIQWVKLHTKAVSVVLDNSHYTLMLEKDNENLDTIKKVGPKKTAAKKVEPKKTAAKKVEPKKTAAKKVEPKKTAAKKVEPKKTAAKKVEPKK